MHGVTQLRLLALVAVGALVAPARADSEPPSPASNVWIDLPPRIAEPSPTIPPRVAASDQPDLNEKLTRDVLLRWETRLDSQATAELAAIVTRLAAATPLVPERTGVPDEVSVQVNYRDATGKLNRLNIWEADFVKLPPGHVALDLLHALRPIMSAVAASGRGVPAEHDDADRRWPLVLEPKN